MGKKLCKSKRDVKISGVCGGIAEYFGIDPTLVRTIWAIVALVGGTGLIAYIVCAIVMPSDPGYIDYSDQPDDQNYNDDHYNKN